MAKTHELLCGRLVRQLCWPNRRRGRRRGWEDPNQRHSRDEVKVRSFLADGDQRIFFSLKGYKTCCKRNFYNASKKSFFFETIMRFEVDMLKGDSAENSSDTCWLLSFDLTDSIACPCSELPPTELPSSTKPSSRSDPETG